MRYGGDGPAHLQIAAFHELGHASLHGSAVKQDVPVAFPASETQVCSQAVDQPLVPAAGVSAPEDHDVTEAELDH
jgi:hypothetical protein